MPITIQCPTCEKTYKIIADQEGRKVRCAKCKYKFIAQAVEIDQTVYLEAPEEITSYELPIKKTGRLKDCPFCAEKINAKALKCRYCGERLDGAAIENQRGVNPSIESLKKYKKLQFIFVCAFFMSLFVAGVSSNYRNSMPFRAVESLAAIMMFISVPGFIFARYKAWMNSSTH